METFISSAVTILCMAMFVLLAYYKSSWAMVIAVVAVADFFSLVDPEIFRLPEVLALNDFILLVLLGFAFLKYRPSREKMSKEIQWAMLFLLFYTFVTVFLTKFRFDTDLLLTLRNGRRYLFYSYLFIFFYNISTRKELFSFIRLLVVASFIASFLLLLQTMVGVSVPIFSYADNLIYQDVLGTNVVRAFMHGATLISFSFFMLFGLFRYDKRYSFYYAAGMCICLMGITLDWGRAFWFGILVSSFVFFFLLNIANDKVRLKMRNIWLIAGGVSSVIVAAMVSSGESIFNLLVNRFTSMFVDLVNQDGTVGYRLLDSAERIDFFLQHPIFGAGFVHRDDFSKLNITTIMPGLQTSDFGLLTLLLDFGLVGFVWLIVLSYLFYKRATYVYRNVSSGVLKGITIGALAFYFSQLFSFITLSGFITQRDIVILAMTIAIVEVIDRIDKKEKNNIRGLSV